MSENSQATACTKQEFDMARAAGLLIVTTADERAVHGFAEAVRSERRDAMRPTPQATDEQVAAGIAAAAALDPVLRSLYPSEVRAIYAAMVAAGAPHAPAQSLALTAFIQDVEAAEGKATGSDA